MSGTDLVLALDLLGVFTFALNGALTASRTVRLDIVGVLTLGILTATGGGVLRDVLIGAVPPDVFTHWYYLTVAAVGALLAFVLAHLPQGLHRAILVLDGVGLSVFCVAGAQKALDFGLDPVPAVLLGAVTAVGGGTLRDILIREVPSVLTTDLYAIPALAGAAVVAATHGTALFGVPAAVLGAVLCFAIRMLGIRYGLHAPSSRTSPGGSSAPTG